MQEWFSSKSEKLNWRKHLAATRINKPHEELPARNLPGGKRVVFSNSIFHSCNWITLAANLALVNYDVTNYREQLQELSCNCSHATKCVGRLPVSYISHRGSPYYIKQTYFGRPKHVLVFMVIQNYKQLPLVVKQSTKPHSRVCCWL